MALEIETNGVAGWYFEFMCETILRKNSFFEIPGKKYIECFF